uniref:Uncharacterized protein n=1 Tax=Anopheles coluzzii TaxID=1518534 RepID=A0A8W7PY26_ANOCL
MDLLTPKYRLARHTICEKWPVLTLYSSFVLARWLAHCFAYSHSSDETLSAGAPCRIRYSLCQQRHSKMNSLSITIFTLGESSPPPPLVDAPAASVPFCLPPDRSLRCSVGVDFGSRGRLSSASCRLLHGCCGHTAFTLTGRTNGSIRETLKPYLRRLGAGRTVLPGSVSIGVMLNSGLLNWIFFDGIFTLLLLLPLPPPIPPTLIMLDSPLPFGSVALGGPLPPAPPPPPPPLLLTLLIDISSISLLENFFSILTRGAPPICIDD